MKSKRGFLLGEFTLKTIIAVMSLVLLLYLLFSFYSSFTTNKNILAAQGVLDKIEEGKVVVGGGEEFIYSLITPKNWIIGSYEDIFVGNCIGKCLCVCKEEGGFLWWSKSQIQRCSNPETGLCLNSEVTLESALNIGEGIDIEIKQKGDEYVLEKK